MTSTCQTLQPRFDCAHVPAHRHRPTGKAGAAVLLGWFALECLSGHAAVTSSTNDAPSVIAIYSLLVDGRPQKIPAPLQFLSSGSNQFVPVVIGNRGRLRVPPLAQRTELRFGPNPASSNPPVRLRYRLEGFDKEWREAGGEMRLNVRFMDAADLTLSARDFSVKGESAGWLGTVTRSRFDRRREVVKVPERAVKMQLELFSGGSEQTVGIMAIDDLTVSVAKVGDEKLESVLFKSRLDVVMDADHLLTNPTGWMRDGSKPSIAVLLKSDGFQAGQMLAVVDTDPTTWGAWRSTPNASVAVHQRDTLILQWKEMYSIGWGGEGECGYSYLPPGEYQFILQALTETGEWTGAMVSLPITVLPPFWQTPVFRGGALMLIVFVLVAGVRFSTKQKMKLQFEHLGRERALEHERTRIARDIHDDLGANLTQIALLSELAQADLEQPAQARSHLKQIFTTAGAVARQLDEIVWAITPANDSLGQFASYVCKYAQDCLRVAGIRCRLEIPDPMPEYSMSSAQRHDLFLATKEALHNVVKHAGADQVWLRLKVHDGALVMVVEDNGNGFSEGDRKVMRGNGLVNMRNRLKYVGGTFEQKSEIGAGTSVRLMLPLNRQ